MPILDVEIVAGAAPAPGLAQRIADAAAEVLAAPPGTLWVKLRHLDPTMYAENASEAPSPVFVSVLRRVTPVSGAADEHERLAAALARAVGAPVDRVHITYEPAAVGRQSFGGHLVE
jgi:phenylpyruvate tautomerase PptA (4-oxalocrotonate tautomerase family)